jgi:hypothetical protein
MTMKDARLGLERRATSVPVQIAYIARSLFRVREILNGIVNEFTEKRYISVRITSISAAEKVLRTKIPCYVTYVLPTLKVALLQERE